MVELSHCYASRRLVMVLGAFASSLPPKPVIAVRGAAELDLEYYARSLLGRNSPPTLQPQETAEGRLLDNDISSYFLEQTAQAISSALGLPLNEVKQRAEERRPSLSLQFSRLMTVGAFGAGRASALRGDGVLAS